MTSLSQCTSHQEMLPFQILLVVVVFHMRSWPWAGFHRASLMPLFTSSQFLNDECLFALREFATKHKLRWEKMRKKKKTLRLYEWMVNVIWHRVIFCGIEIIFQRGAVSPTVTFMSEWLGINWRKGIDSIQPNVLLIWQQGKEIGNYIRLVLPRLWK